MIEHGSDVSMEKMFDFFLQPDALLSSQNLETTLRKIHHNPEKMLTLAVLENGLTCFREYISARDVKGKRLFREAEQWILEENGNWLFSFDNTCETIGLNSQNIREELLRRRYYRQWGSIGAEPPKKNGQFV